MAPIDGAADLGPSGLSKRTGTPGMAWIDKRTTKGGEPRYDVGYRDPSNKVRRKTFRRERDAKAYLRTVEADVERGQWIDPRAGAISLRDYADGWFCRKQPTLQAKTQELYESEL